MYETELRGGPRIGRILFFTGLFAPARADTAEHRRALYSENCADCHLADGTGDDTAPDITGVSRTTIARAIRGYDEMPAFELNAAEIDALVAWLAATR